MNQEPTAATPTPAATTDLERQLAEARASLDRLQADAGAADRAVHDLVTRAVRIAEQTAAENADLRRRLEVVASTPAPAPVPERAASLEGLVDLMQAIFGEFRAPLDATADSLARLSKQRLARNSIDPVRDALTNVGLLQQLFDTFTEVPELYEGDLETEPALFELQPFIEGSAARLAAIAAAYGLQFRHRVEAGLPTEVYGDAMRIHRGLCHLAGHAFPQAKGGTVQMIVSRRGDTDDGCLVHFEFALTGDLRADGDTGGSEAVASMTGGSGLSVIRRLADCLGGTLVLRPMPAGEFAVGFSVALTQPGRGAADRRDGASRSMQVMLQSSHGPVIDLSPTGARVLCRKVPKGPIDLAIFEQGGGVKLRAQAAWSRTVGRRQHEIGFRFAGVKPAEQRALERIAWQHGMKR